MAVQIVTDFEMPLTYREAAEAIGLVDLMGLECRITVEVNGEWSRWGVQTFAEHIQQLRRMGQVPFQAITGIELVVERQVITSLE